MLSKRCSTKAMRGNVRTLIHEGKPQKQAVAIGYRTLTKACGCRTTRRRTPTQIVACKRR